jgi:hypothetical protein
MRKLILAITVSAMACASGAAAAQMKADMAKISCADLSQLYADEFLVLGAWMSGYYNAKRNNTLIDVKQLAINTKNVLGFCNKNPKMTVMKAIETMTAASK